MLHCTTSGMCPGKGLSIIFNFKKLQNRITYTFDLRSHFAPCEHSIAAVTLYEVNFYKAQTTRCFYIPFPTRKENPIIFRRSIWFSRECKSSSRLEIRIGIKSQELLQNLRALPVWPGLQQRWALRRPLWRQYQLRVSTLPAPAPRLRLASSAGGTALTCPVKSLLAALRAHW